VPLLPAPMLQREVVRLYAYAQLCFVQAKWGGGCNGFRVKNPSHSNAFPQTVTTLPWHLGTATVNVMSV